MKIDFDFDKAGRQFGVGRDTNGDSTSCSSRSTAMFGALREMAVATKDAMYGLADKPTLYSPSEKHSSLEFWCCRERMTWLSACETLRCRKHANRLAGSY